MADLPLHWSNGSETSELPCRSAETHNLGTEGHEGHEESRPVNPSIAFNNQHAPRRSPSNCLKLRTRRTAPALFLRDLCELLFEVLSHRALQALSLVEPGLEQKAAKDTKNRDLLTLQSHSTISKRRTARRPIGRRYEPGAQLRLSSFVTFASFCSKFCCIALQALSLVEPGLEQKAAKDTKIETCAPFQSHSTISNARCSPSNCLKLRARRPPPSVFLRDLCFLLFELLSHRSSQAFRPR